tara:strand:+ start:272 stop:535 length:264 start_codon:yes stop_codon:yes gene_type:complete
MFKELKYFLYLSIISLFFFLLIKYYFSDDNIKNSYRSYKQVNEKITMYSQNVILLKSDTIGIVEYVEKNNNKNKKSFNFWKLININE